MPRSSIKANDSRNAPVSWPHVLLGGKSDLLLDVGSLASQSVELFFGTDYIGESLIFPLFNEYINVTL